MSNLTDRISGLALVAFAGFIWFVLIPWQVETVRYGAMHPKTMPQILAALLAAAGLALVFRPSPAHGDGKVRWIKPALQVAILFAGLYLMSLTGFLIVAPALALVLMVSIGERRPFWLLLGAGGMPALIWLCVSVLLERPLP